ncbi:MAG: S24/S26 family peptidase [Oscillospiraceae bacterium]|nr:S24/S26 family peptidase [Oscillospiraceae bacterium]
MAEYIAPILETKIAVIYPVLKKLLDMDKDVKITVTGGSMYPFLRGGKDSVILESAECYHPRRFDIVLVVRQNHQFILHRIVAIKKDSFYILGDAQKRKEGPYTTGQVAAVVKDVCRNGKTISTKSFQWRILSRFWHWLTPMHLFLIRIHIKIRSFCRAYL